MVNIHVSSYTQNRTFTRCVNLVIQVLNSYVTIKSVVVLNLEVEVSFPTTRYGISEEVLPLMTDLRPDLYISDIDLLQFEELLNNITTSYSFNSLATYLFISANWTTIEDQLFSRHISKIVFVNCSATEKALKIWDVIEPVISDKSKGKKEEEKPTIGVSKEIKRKPFRTNLKLCISGIWFPQSICINCTNKNKGIIVEVFNMFSDFMGQSPSYIDLKTDDFPYRDKLILKECDVCYRGLLSENSLVDFILSLRNDYDYWHVPRSPEIATWKYMVTALPIEIWLIWITVSIIVSFLKWMLTKIVNLGLKQHPLEVLEIASKYFLEQQGNTNITLCSNMFFFYGMVLSVFIMNVTYKTRFTWLLLGRNFYPQDIQTVQDAAAKGLFVTYSQHLKNNLETLYPELAEYFTSHFVSSDEQNWVEMVAFRKNTIALKTSLNAKYLRQFYLDENGRSLIDVLEKPMQQSICGFSFLKGDPILSKMSKFINLLRDHGFLSYILAKYDLRVYDGVDVENRRLGFKQMKGPFLAWFVGNSIGCIIFIVEFVINMSLEV